MIGAIDVPQIIHKSHSTNRTIVSSWLCLPNFEYFFLFFCLRFWRLCFFWCAHFFNDLLGLSFRWCNFFPEIVTVRDVVDKGLGQTVIFVHIFPLNIWEIGSLIGMKIEHWNHCAGEHSVDLLLNQCSSHILLAVWPTNCNELPWSSNSLFVALKKIGNLLH